MNQACSEHDMGIAGEDSMRGTVPGKDDLKRSQVKGGQGKSSLDKERRDKQSLGNFIMPHRGRSGSYEAKDSEDAGSELENEKKETIHKRRLQSFAAGQ